MHFLRHFKNLYYHLGLEIIISRSSPCTFRQKWKSTSFLSLREGFKEKSLSQIEQPAAVHHVIVIGVILYRLISL